MEIEDINEKEMFKQMKEEMLKNEHYVRLEIIITDDSNTPYCNTELHKCSQYMVMKLLSVLDSVKESYIKKDPILKLYSMIIGTKDCGSIETNKEE